MRVLWICNMILPAIAKVKNLSYSEREGWLSGIYEQVMKEKQLPIQLGIAYPGSGDGIEKTILDRCTGYAFPEDIAAPEVYDIALEEHLAWIISDYKPDMIHVFGTEFPHALAAVRAFGRPDKTLIGIQGLCYLIAKVYTKDIPDYVVNRKTFRDAIKRDSILAQKEKFRLRGEYEKEAIRLARHITGRTEFDKEGALRLNQDARYHFMNETMRSCFYEGKWQEENCRKHSIFLSQGDYPIKGLHYVLQVLPKLREKYPDVHLYVAGNSIVANRTAKDRLKLSSYGKYLLQLIRKNHLKKCVTILGKLDAGQMKEQFMQSHVFVCPSIIENSPNALAEAMLLGVPVVAAATGGIPSMLEDGKEGILYPPGDMAGLMWGIIRAFEVGKVFSDQERERAAKAHDGESNYQTLLSVYREIVKE